MNCKKISVIVPVYKVEAYLDKCVKSIMNQTYENLEIILVDDGSPDNCGSICDEYAKNDKRVRVIHKENGGLSSARNSGLDLCTGEYVSFVDSDDWIDSKLYENLMNEINKEEVDLLEFKSVKVFDNKEEKFEDTYEYKTFIDNEALKSYYEDGRLQISSWSKIYKKELFDNIRFPEGRLAEDLYTTYRVLYKAKKVGFIDYTGYYYYIREDSIMGSYKPELIRDVFEGMQQEHKFICEKAPNLKPYIDKLYFNCLLKTYAYFNQKNISEDMKGYKKIVAKELDRIDLNVTGSSKLAFFIYKISPSIFTVLINFIFNRKRR